MDKEINQGARLTPEERSAKIKKLKKKRRIRLAIVIAAFVLGLTLIVGPIVMFFVFRVNKFVVEGISPYSRETIISSCGVEKGKSLVFVDVDDVAAASEKNLPYTDDVKVTKKLPDSLVIRYGETFKAFAFQLSGGTYAVTDSNLKVLEMSSAVPDGVALIKGVVPVGFEAGDLISFTEKSDDENETDKTFSLLLEITKAVAENSMKDINLIDVSSANDIYFIYQERLVLRFGEPSDRASKISLGQRVIQDEDKIDPSQFATVNLTIQKKAYVNPADPEDIKELVVYNGGEWEEPEMTTEPVEVTSDETETE